MAERWFYTHAGQTHGPLSTAVLKEHAAQGSLLPDDLLWSENAGRDQAVAASAALDFTALPPAAAPLPDWMTDVAPAPPLEPPQWVRAIGPLLRASAGSPSPAPEWIQDLDAFERHSAELLAEFLLTQDEEPPEPPSAGPPAGTLPAAVEKGFDPDTGRIHDPAKFKQWQAARRAKEQQEAAARPSAPAPDPFRNACKTLADWVDEDANRSLVLFSPVIAVRQDPFVREFLRQHERYGRRVVERLGQYLEFLVDNRRKYYEKTKNQRK